jgi:hypothetical protein
MMSPLTVLLTEEQMRLKQKQIKEKAPPPGAAKILTRARKEQKKQQQQQPPGPIITPHPPNQTPQIVTPTIKEKVEVVASKSISVKDTQRSKVKAFDESVAINATNREKESGYLKNNVDSDDEWQNLLEDNTGLCSWIQIC